MVVAQRPHVYDVQNIAFGEVRDVHVARMRFYADTALAITVELKELYQHASTPVSYTHLTLPTIYSV